MATTGEGGSATTERKTTAPRAGEGGNWACPNCTNINYHYRTHCNRCKDPKPGMGPLSVDHGGPIDQIRAAKHLLSMFRGAHDPIDAAANCLMHAQQELQQELAYGGYNSSSDPYGGPAGPPRGPGGFGQPSYQQQPAWGSFQDSRKRRRAPQAGVDGNWQCTKCPNINFPMRQVCNMCQAPKPADSYQQDPAAAARPPMYGGQQQH